MNRPQADILIAIAEGKAIQTMQNYQWIDCAPEIALSHLSNGIYGPSMRIKPAAPLTINGHEVPQPRRTAPKEGESYVVVDLTDPSLASDMFWEDDSRDQAWLEHGLVHDTREAAIAHAKALLSFTEIK